MELPAQSQEFLLKHAHFEPKLTRQFQHREIVALLRRLQDLAAARAEMCPSGALMAVPADQRRIRHRGQSTHGNTRLTQTQKKWLARCGGQPLVRPSQQGTDRSPCNRYAVNELPQPQLRAALGFWKTKPCRISVSSYSSVVPLRYRRLLGSTKIRAPNSSNTLSRSRACVSKRMA